jgi:hypothetical protein
MAFHEVHTAAGPPAMSKDSPALGISASRDEAPPASLVVVVELNRNIALVVRPLLLVLLSSALPDAANSS